MGCRRFFVGCVGRTSTLLERSWSLLGCIWGGSGGDLGGLGAPFGGSEAVLGPSWLLLSPSSQFWLALGRLLAALGSLLVALGPLLGCSWAALGALLTTFDDPSWPKLSSKMPSDTLLGRKDEYAKRIGKRKEKHTFLIRRWVRILASKPLRPILERSCPSWRELGVSGGDLGASWGDLGAILGAQGGARWEGGRRHDGGAGPPLEEFYRRILHIRRIQNKS